jgi:hypothetical protein
MWLLKEHRQQIGASTVALPALPWQHSEGADSAAAGCTEAVLRQKQTLYLSCYPGEGRQAGEVLPHFNFLLLVLKDKGLRKGYKKRWSRNT